MPISIPFKFAIEIQLLSGNVSISKDFLRRDRPYKNKPAVLVGGMCAGHVRSDTQQRQTPCVVLIFHALYREQIPTA